MRAAINNMDICRRPQIFRDIEKSRQETFPLKFRSPCRKRHPRISKKILEDIKAVGIQTNSFYSIFSNFLRYTAKRLGVFLLAVYDSSSQATSKNIVENLRRYKGCQHTNEFILSYILKYSEIYREAVRGFPTCSVGLLVASDIQEYFRRYKGYQHTNKFILSYILKFSEIYREAVRSLPTCSVEFLVASDI